MLDLGPAPVSGDPEEGSAHEPTPQRYGPRQVFQWVGPGDEYQVDTVEVVASVDQDEWAVEHVWVTVRNDRIGTESRLDLDVYNARRLRDAIVAALDWLGDQTEGSA